MTRDTLLSKVDVSAGQVHRIKGEVGDVEQAAREYEQEASELRSIRRRRASSGRSRPAPRGAGPES